jgi:hypothetical protein
VRIDREPDTMPDRHMARDIAFAAHEYLRASMRCWFPTTVMAPQLEIVDAARAKSQADTMPVVLDSRHRMLEFSGVTAATPNEAEVEEALSVKIGQDWGLFAPQEAIVSA